MKEQTRRSRAGAAALRVAALAALAIGWPILQLVQTHPEFLAAHQAARVDILILTFALLGFVPAVFASWALAIAQAGERLRRFGWAAADGLLLLLICLPLFGRVPSLGPWSAVLLACATALVVARLLSMPQVVQVAARLLVVGIPVLIAVFLFSTPIRKIVFAPPVPLPASLLAARTPIVIIVFDEFPVSSLMGPGETLDSELFPNFARLAARSTWYRNATTVSGSTVRSVPAILTGRMPQWDESPTVVDHPFSIFTMLRASHEMTVLETQTDLCPRALRGDGAPPLTSRLTLLASDLRILYQHIVVPPAWRHLLTPIAGTWANFGKPGAVADAARPPATRSEEFLGFVEEVRLGDRPVLAFGHVLMPHSTYTSIPGGQVYSARRREPMLPGNIWGPDSVLADDAFRRHLLQAATTDWLLGVLLDRLVDLGILDETIIVITSDHGASFRLGENHRQFGPGNAADIVSIPLFIKLPQQQTGVIDDRLVQTIDILPTIAGALGGARGWDFDGVDLNAVPDEPRAVIDFMDPDARLHRRLEAADLRARRDVIRRKQALFADHRGLRRLWAMGPHGGLVGRDLAEFSVGEHDHLEVVYEEPQQLESVRLDATFVPLERHGRVRGRCASPRVELALAVNGIIAGVATTALREPDTDEAAWGTLILPEALREGSNTFDLYAIEDASEQAALLRLPVACDSALGRDFGGQRQPDVREGGLYPTENWGDRSVRWTNGSGRWDIPLAAGDRPRLLRVQILATGPGGTSLTIAVNGVPLATEDIASCPWETSVPIRLQTDSRRLIVTLDSRTFVPATAQGGSDRRSLGVAVDSLILE